MDSSLTPTNHAARTAVLAAGLSLSLSACAARQVPIAVVREARLRTEAQPFDRITLPLNDASQARLIDFLEKGGDTRRSDLVDPQAQKRYLPLLRLLSSSRHLASDELTAKKKTFGQWFPKPFTDQVIDARNDAPPSTGVAAVSDGRYWWIFYIRDGRLAELLVTQAIGYRPAR